VIDFVLAGRVRDDAVRGVDLVLLSSRNVADCPGVAGLADLVSCRRGEDRTGGAGRIRERAACLTSGRLCRLAELG
jgi:hypothetical protein